MNEPLYRVEEINGVFHVFARGHKAMDECATWSREKGQEIADALSAQAQPPTVGVVLTEEERALLLKLAMREREEACMAPEDDEAWRLHKIRAAETLEWIVARMSSSQQSQALAGGRVGAYDSPHGGPALRDAAES